MKKIKGLNCILLIDDEEINNYLNTILIEKTDIDVHVEVALNGKEGIEYLTSTGKYSNNKTFPQPGLILLDINMPRMNGWEFLEEYDKLEEGQKGKIVVAMLTSSNNPDDLKRANSKKNLVGFLSKPLSIETMEEVIYKYFPEED